MTNTIAAPTAPIMIINIGNVSENRNIKMNIIVLK